MKSEKTIRVGVVGLGQRGSMLIDTVLACAGTEIAAVCDLYEDRVSAAAEKVRGKQKTPPAQYRDFEDLLADFRVEVVIVSVSWEEHVRIACASMQAKKITALEVGGAYCLEDCWKLVHT